MLFSSTHHVTSVSSSTDHTHPFGKWRLSSISARIYSFRLTAMCEDHNTMALTHHDTDPYACHHIACRTNGSLCHVVERQVHGAGPELVQSAGRRRLD